MRAAAHWSPILLLTGVLMAGCAGQRVEPPMDEHGEVRTGTPTTAVAPTGARIANVALSMVGTSYRFGGATPQGFDCSGLVFFAYQQAGIEVPRTARAQRRMAMPVAVRSVRVGDLLFFDTSWKDGHVGIYVGDGQFVHAPSSGKEVSVERLDVGYYVGRVEGAGRLHAER